MSQISGIELATIAEPIRPALQKYSEQTDGAVTFDIDAAAVLELTPDKPNSARSATPVRHLGEIAGTLYVIVFDMEDGTGDEKTFKLQDSMLGGNYPLESKIVPRSKAGIHSEAHLAIASLYPYSDEDPVMFANNLDLVTLTDQHRLRQLGYLGQSLYDLSKASVSGTELDPTVTLTTGYSSESGERFGDPHAVYNKRLTVQVAAFLAVTDEMAAEHGQMLQSLGAVEPSLRF